MVLLAGVASATGDGSVAGVGLIVAIVVVLIVMSLVVGVADIQGHNTECTRMKEYVCRTGSTPEPGQWQTTDSHSMPYVSACRIRLRHIAIAGVFHE